MHNRFSKINIFEILFQIIELQKIETVYSKQFLYLRHKLQYMYMYKFMKFWSNGQYSVVIKWSCTCINVYMYSIT